MPLEHSPHSNIPSVVESVVHKWSRPLLLAIYKSQQILRSYGSLRVSSVSRHDADEMMRWCGHVLIIASVDDGVVATRKRSIILPLVEQSRDRDRDRDRDRETKKNIIQCITDQLLNITSLFTFHISSFCLPSSSREVLSVLDAALLHALQRWEVRKDEAKSAWRASRKRKR